MRTQLRWVCNQFERWSQAWTWLAGVLIILLALLSVGLVLARYVGAWTHNGLDELRWHLFGAIFLFAMAGCFANDAHVRVDVIAQYFSRRVKAWIDIVLSVVVLVPMCVVMMLYGTWYAKDAWNLSNGRLDDHWAQSWSQNDESSLTYGVVATIEQPLRRTVIRGERSPNEGGLEARWIVKSFIPLGFALLMLQALAHIGRKILVIMGDEDASAATDRLEGPG